MIARIMIAFSRITVVVARIVARDRAAAPWVAHEAEAQRRWTPGPPTRASEAPTGVLLYCRSVVR
jgi:hypothetical protein